MQIDLARILFGRGDNLVVVERVEYQVRSSLLSRPGSKVDG